MKTRSWQVPRDEKQLQNAFIRHCARFGIRPSLKHFQAFLLWSRDNRAIQYDQFLNHCATVLQQTRAALGALDGKLKNGKKGEEYAAELEFPVSRYKLNGLEELGLSWQPDPVDPKKCRITGIPVKAGEFSITLYYVLDGYLQKCFPHGIHAFKFIVNPDPKDLWQNIPSDQSGEYARPDQQSQYLLCGPAHIYAASLRGRSHAHKGLPRDDAFAIACESGWQIIALADGAGSAEFSRRGAELACNTALSVVSASLDDAGASLVQLLTEELPGANEQLWQPQARKLAYDILARAAFEAHKAIREEAAQKSREMKTYATTLLLTVTRQLPNGWLVLSFQIGDGAMALLAENGPVLLAKPDEGEYSGQTKFLTMAEIFDSHELMRRVRVSCVARLEALLMMTDGVSDPKFGSEEDLGNPKLWLALKNELETIFEAPNPADALLDWLNFWEKGHHDDRTLAMLLTEVG